MKENQLDSQHNLKGTPAQGEIPSCCLETIQELAEHNPMMACPHCENIIKRFEDQSAFENYAKFCQSRRRKIQKAYYKAYKIILFHLCA